MHLHSCCLDLDPVSLHRVSSERSLLVSKLDHFYSSGRMVIIYLDGVKLLLEPLPDLLSFKELSCKSCP